MSGAAPQGPLSGAGAAKPRSRPITSSSPSFLGRPAGAAGGGKPGTERDGGPPRPEGAEGRAETPGLGVRGEVGFLWGPQNPASAGRGGWVGFPCVREPPPRPCCPRLARPPLPPAAGPGRLPPTAALCPPAPPSPGAAAASSREGSGL